jgi:hypothetical protein
MTHEVRAIALEVNDVVGITQEVFAWSSWASPITAPVKHEQTLTVEEDIRLCHLSKSGTT